MRLRFFALTALALVAACDDLAEEEAIEMDAGVREPREAGREASTVADAGDAAAKQDARDAVAEIFEAGPTPVTVDGVISAGEYGVHTDGQNQKTEPQSNVTWFMRWTDTTLHVAVSGANPAEAAVLYVGPGALAPDAGSEGTTQGFATYDSTRLDPLPFRASFVVYFKKDYQEYRVWTGSAWGAAVTSGVTFASNGTVREMGIPWTAIRAAGKPQSFAFNGYVTTAAGFAYGEMPPDNPSGSIGTTAVFPYYYRVTNVPFATRVP
jgi:hypothetical protein